MQASPFLNSILIFYKFELYRMIKLVMYYETSLLFNTITKKNEKMWCTLGSSILKYSSELMRSY